VKQILTVNTMQSAPNASGTVDSALKPPPPDMAYCDYLKSYKNDLDIQARFVIMVSVLKVSYFYRNPEKKNNNWWLQIKDTVTEHPFWESCTDYSALEYMFPGRGYGGPVKEHGVDRGRAAGILRRWILSNKIWKKSKKERGGVGRPWAATTRMNWLVFYGSDPLNFFDLFYKHMDDAEHLMRIGPVSKNHRMVPKSIPSGNVKVYEGHEEAARLVVKGLRKQFITDFANGRAMAREHLNKLLFFVLRKILHDRGEADYNPEKSKYKIILNNDVPDEADFMEVGVTEVATSEDATTVNETNNKMLEVLSAKWKRFHIELHWVGEVETGRKKTVHQKRRCPSVSSQSSKRGKVSSGTPSSQPLSPRLSMESESPVDSSDQYAQADSIFSRAELKALVLEFPDVRLGELYKHIPTIPDGPFERKRDVSLHTVAAEVLCEFLRMKKTEDVLRSDAQALRAVHCIAMGLSALLRGALDKDGESTVLEIEKIARGNVTHVLQGGEDPDCIGIIPNAADSDGGGIAPMTERNLRDWFVQKSDAYIYEELRKWQKNKEAGDANPGVATTTSPSGASSAPSEPTAFSGFKLDM